MPGQTQSEQTAAQKRVQQKTEEAKHVAEATKAAGLDKPGYKVAPGKSVTTVRGIVDSGSPVTAHDFCRRKTELEFGQLRLDELVEKDLVVKK